MGSANPACYVAEGRLRKVSADRGIFTGELPADQVEALNDQHKVPLIYANVLLRSWESLAKLGIARFTVPGGFWEECRIDYPVSIAATASLAARTSPCCSTSSRPRLARRGNREQSRAGRYALTDLTFAEMEFQIRDLLTRAVGPGGPARDVEAITINRWSHGYSYEYMRPWDRYWPQGKLPIDVFLPISSSLL